MKTRRVLFIDFDNTLFDTLPMTLDYLSRRWGVPRELMQNSDIVDRCIAEMLTSKHPDGAIITREEAYEDLGAQLYHDRGLHASAWPIAGSVETVPKLAEKYDLYIVTARQESGRPIIDSLLNQHFPGNFKGVHNVWNHLGNGEFEERPKRDFINEFKRELRAAHIDDSLHEINSIMDVAPALLFDPDSTRKNSVIKHVTGWEQIGEMFL